MPIKNLENIQRQKRLFQEELNQDLNTENKLYKLRKIIGWEVLEKEITKLIDIKQLGRERISVRVMLGLSMLQAMHNGSDAFTSEMIEENMYWQYFCGYEYFESELSVSESTVRRFRNILGEQGYSLILQELIRVGIKVGSCKKKDLEQEKEAYKAVGNKIIYSFHEPEVECIGKGKLNKPYEFGNKVSVAISGRGNFILGIKSFQDNPYDGHTLAEAVEQVEKLTEYFVNKIFVDLGYRGNNYKAKGKVYTPYTKKKITPEIKCMQKRRSAVEPVIGHLKNFGRMGRNYLKGVIGNIINPFISAIGFNLRNIANRLLVAT